MMQTDFPDRPRWNHTSVKEEAATSVVEDVYQWGRMIGFDLEGDKQNRAIIYLAMRETPDAYGALRYLEDFCSWPVDDTLYRIFAEGYARTHKIVKTHIHAWVMENNVRVACVKGDRVKFRMASVELTGRVLEVIKREARAIIQPIEASGTLPPYSVNSENILEVLPKRKTKHTDPDSPRLA